MDRFTVALSTALVALAGPATAAHYTRDFSFGPYNDTPECPGAPLLRYGFHAALYGVAATGRTGVDDAGGVFTVGLDGMVSFTHVFDRATEGANPTGLTVGADGWLYGTNASSGPTTNGVAWRMDAAAGTTYPYYRFGAPGEPDVGTPSGTPVIDSPGGNLYGRTDDRAPAVYRLSPGGELTVLHRFTDPADGQFLWADLALSEDGVLYGSTYQGGAHDGGTLFRLRTDGTGFRVLHDFDCATEPCHATGNVAIDPLDGGVWGTTFSGSGDVVGGVYHLDAHGFHVAHAFHWTDKEGYAPWGGITFDGHGGWLGVTQGGAANHVGAVFQLHRDGRVRILHVFSGQAHDVPGDGGRPTPGYAGDLYGTSCRGGHDKEGLLWRITP